MSPKLKQVAFWLVGLGGFVIVEGLVIPYQLSLTDAHR